MECLEGIGLFDFLQHDPRPSLVLDLQASSWSETDRLPSAFQNTSLRVHPDLSSLCSGHINLSSDSKEKDFVHWALKHTPHTLSYNGFTWVSFTLRKRWKIISGTKTNHDTPATAATDSRIPISPVLEAGAQSKRTKGVDGSPSIWTDSLPESPHTQFFRRTNWSATSLGRLSSWPELLRHMTRFLMADSRAACLFW